MPIGANLRGTTLDCTHCAGSRQLPVNARQSLPSRPVEKLEVRVPGLSSHRIPYRLAALTGSLKRIVSMRIPIHHILHYVLYKQTSSDNILQY